MRLSHCASNGLARAHTSQLKSLLNSNHSYNTSSYRLSSPDLEAKCHSPALGCHSPACSLVSCLLTSRDPAFSSIFTMDRIRCVACRCKALLGDFLFLTLMSFGLFQTLLSCRHSNRAQVCVRLFVNERWFSDLITSMFYFQCMLQAGNKSLLTYRADKGIPGYTGGSSV